MCRRPRGDRFSRTRGTTAYDSAIELVAVAQVVDFALSDCSHNVGASRPSRRDRQRDRQYARGITYKASSRPTRVSTAEVAKQINIIEQNI